MFQGGVHGIVLGGEFTEYRHMLVCAQAMAMPIVQMGAPHCDARLTRDGEAGKRTRDGSVVEAGGN